MATVLIVYKPTSAGNVAELVNKRELESNVDQDGCEIYDPRSVYVLVKVAT